MENISETPKKKQRTPINNRLTVKQVKQVRKYQFKKPAREIAAKYNVHIQTIYKIWSGSNWAWLE